MIFYPYDQLDGEITHQSGVGDKEYSPGAHLIWNILESNLNIEIRFLIMQMRIRPYQ